MLCQTCNHAMQMIFNATNHKAWWCERCGTLKDDKLGHISQGAPKLVERCRQYEAGFDHENIAQYYRNQWRIEGIAESINLPANRPQ